ncbi:MAG: zinc-dependent metalloprotease [Saprospiraceae bacterium]|nr:zinc-dependent metalloprotease [Saprospiraceae bacterium]
MSRLFNLFLLACLLCPLATFAQSGDEPEKKDTTAVKEAKAKGPKTYKEVVTDKAVSQTGMVTVHRLEDKYLFDIPDSLFGRDIMAVTRLSRTPAGAGYGGEEQNRQVIRFEKGPGDKVFLRAIEYVNVSADTSLPLYEAVRNANLDPIAAVFEVKAYRDDKSGAVIDVTDFLGGAEPIISLSPITKQRFNLTEFKKDRSYIDRVNAYPINVEVRSVKTFAAKPPVLRTGEEKPSPSTDLPAGLAAGAVTFEQNTSFILLPKTPMRKRYYDPRVGYFATRYTVYDDNKQRAEPETFAVRWRLEPKNAEDAARQQRGEPIEPAKPIVFYIDPATPLQWRPYLKQGVEDWQPAFEQAGWKNAIQARDWPENDTTMSLEDARFSVIRYFASDIQNAYGPNVHDPRSGEIIESHIGWFHNVMMLLKRWYTTQAAAVDPAARKNEFDDALMGRLIRFVSAHEVGHTIGLRHNFGASHATPVEKLRDPAFCAANGHTSSIMDYARFNYVAQPEDGIKDLFPRVGDYDKWAIEWGYKPIYNTADAEADKKTLNQWYLDKAAPNPRLHFTTESSPVDPRAQSEDLGDNSMTASAYGIKNLQRIVPNIEGWTKDEADHYTMARELHDDVVMQYRRYIGHVTKWVGGVYETPKTYEQAGAVYQQAPAERQREAVAFLNREVFQTPAWLFPPALTAKLTADGGASTINSIHQSTLDNLLSTTRLQRVALQKDYGLMDLFEDVQNGVWTELDGGKATSPERRSLQKMHLEKMIGLSQLATDDKAADRLKTSDIPSAALAALDDLEDAIEKAAKRAKDPMTEAHLEDCLARIEAVEED